MAAPSSIISVGGVLLLFVILSVATGTEAAVSGGGDNVVPVCKTVGGGSTFFDVEFCISTLRTDAASPIAKTYRDFATIAVRLLTNNAVSTAARINGLNRAGGGRDKARTRCLESCQALYEGILDRNRVCADAIKGGKFGEAAAGLEKSAADVKACEGGFAKSGVASPVTAEDDNAFKIAKLAVALLRFAL
ncbi:hypothetical protein EJB05_54694, partial [Eragrostis curvula]